MLHDAPPRSLRRGERVLEEWREHKVGELGLLRVCVADAIQEFGSDDAAATPDGRERPEVEAPSILFRSGGQVLEALRVRDDLGGIQRLAHVVDQRRPF